MTPLTEAQREDVARFMPMVHRAARGNGVQNDADYDAAVDGVIDAVRIHDPQIGSLSYSLAHRAIFYRTSVSRRKHYARWQRERLVARSGATRDAGPCLVDARDEIARCLRIATPGQRDAMLRILAGGHPSRKQQNCIPRLRVEMARRESRRTGWRPI